MAVSEPHTPKKKKARTYNVLAICCATWFLLTGWVWAYGGALFIAYPAALAGLILWLYSRRLDRESGLNKIAMWMLIAGLAVSIGSIFIYK